MNVYYYKGTGAATAARVACAMLIHNESAYYTADGVGFPVAATLPYHNIKKLLSIKAAALRQLQ
jgi:hypothetical protein